jgi:glycosyltransferase involved in cell wall biosynthesis
MRAFGASFIFSQALTIAHVSTQRGWHGGEEQARLLCEGLRKQGHRNLIFARGDGRFAERMRADGFEVHFLPGSGRGLAAIWRMRREWRRHCPDVVHFHDPHALSGGGLAAWRLGIPARIVARRVDFPIRSIWRYRHWVDRAIAVSSAVAEVCRNSGVPAEKIRVVLDGVDPRRAQSGDRERGRAALGIGNDALLLLTVATLTDHKGHTYLLRAMPKILAELGSRPVVLALAGDGELRQALEAEVAATGLESTVRFLGFRSDVPDLIKAADLFVMPSHMEGLCSTLIDVMFARTPIVTTTAGGIPDLVGPFNGEPEVARLVPPRDPAALAQAIVAAIGDLPALQTMIYRAEARALSRFTDEQMVEGTLGVYRELATASVEA